MPTMIRVAVGVLLLAASAGCRNECHDACKKASDDAIGSCQGEACKQAVVAYDACLRACEGKK